MVSRDDDHGQEGGDGGVIIFVVGGGGARPDFGIVLPGSSFVKEERREVTCAGGIGDSVYHCRSDSPAQSED